MAIPDLPTDPRLAAVAAARERLIDLKLGVAIASGITMVALTGAVAYSTNLAVAASAQNGTLAPSGTSAPADSGSAPGSSEAAPAPATNTPVAPPNANRSGRSSGSTGPARNMPRIVTAQS